MREEAGNPHEYDVALSFAGENRAYVEAVADALKRSGVRVFYDDYEKISLWGKDLYAHLDFVYRKAARYCVVFISSDYATKVWTNHERTSAQARALEENREYVLPARFDATEVEGLRPTIGYVDLTKTSPEELARMIREKLGPRRVTEYFPSVPDRLFEKMRISEETEKKRVSLIAHALYNAMRRMSQDERAAIAGVLAFGCPAELPEFVHVSLDLLHRVTRLAPAQLLQSLGAVKSLGFTIRTRDFPEIESNELTAPSTDVTLSWFCNFVPDAEDATEIARIVVLCASDHYCEDHGLDVIDALDFHLLALGADGLVTI